jgi:hypothetical protein
MLEKGCQIGCIIVSTSATKNLVPFAVEQVGDGGDLAIISSVPFADSQGDLYSRLTPMAVDPGPRPRQAPTAIGLEVDPGMHGTSWLDTGGDVDPFV